MTDTNPDEGGMDSKHNLRSVAIMDFADVLLPGDKLFPSARGSGMALLLMARLDQAGLTDRLETAVRAAGGPLGPIAVEQRYAIVTRMEAGDRKLFEQILKAVYLTYYEQPAVIEAIRATGLRYNDRPLPDGYPVEPFHAERDAPRHERGRWIRADDVTRVDLSALEFLRGPVA